METLSFSEGECQSEGGVRQGGADRIPVTIRRRGGENVVDDFALMANGPTYLADHLRIVVDELQQEGMVELAPLGIGYRAHDFYIRRDFVEAPGELGAKLIELLEAMLVKSAPISPPTQPPLP